MKTTSSSKALATASTQTPQQIIRERLGAKPTQGDVLNFIKRHQSISVALTRKSIDAKPGISYAKAIAMESQLIVRAERLLASLRLKAKARNDKYYAKKIALAKKYDLCVSSIWSVDVTQLLPQIKGITVSKAAKSIKTTKVKKAAKSIKVTKVKKAAKSIKVTTVKPIAKTIKVTKVKTKVTTVKPIAKKVAKVHTPKIAAKTVRAEKTQEDPQVLMSLFQTIEDLKREINAFKS